MIQLRFAAVTYTEDGCISWFGDGTFWGAQPHYTHHYHVIAHRLGYGDDVLAYCREHEVCHHLICEWLLERHSPILWGLAHGEEIDPNAAVFEEMGAQALQRWVRANERPIIGGVDWDSLKQRALELMS